MRRHANATRLNRLLPAPLIIGALNYRVGSTGRGRMAIFNRVPTFVLKRKGHSCQKSETIRNDRAFTA
jgi:hypothetical protein